MVGDIEARMDASELREWLALFLIEQDEKDRDELQGTVEQELTRARRE